MSQSSNNYLQSEWLTAFNHAHEVSSDQLIRRIIETVKELFRADAGGLYLLDEGERKLKLFFRSGQETTITNHTVEVGEGLAGRVAPTRMPHMLRDWDEWIDQTLSFDNRSPRSVMAIPLATSTRILGVLYLSSTARHFTKSDTKLLNSWSIFIVVVLTSAARLEYVRKTIVSQEGLIDQRDELSQNDWEAFFEGFFQGLREDIKRFGTPPGLEGEQININERLAAISRLRGSFRTKVPAPDDEGVREDYLDYLMKKYS